MTRNLGLIFAHAEADAARRRQWLRGVNWLAIAIVPVLLYELTFYPRSHTTRVSATRAVDIANVMVDAHVLDMFGAHAADLEPALVVYYLSDAADSQSAGLERVDVFEWARPQAEMRDLHAVVLWRTRYVFTRFLPVVGGDVLAFRRRPDGTWTGLCDGRGPGGVNCEINRRAQRARPTASVSHRT